MNAYDSLVMQAAIIAKNGRHVTVPTETLNGEMGILIEERIAEYVANPANGEWIADPWVNNVWGWKIAASGNIGLVYYRHAADFGASHELYELTARKPRRTVK